MAARGEFSSKLAFILAASGSAIGLGNIWGFPILVAENGGGAFVLVYIVLAFLLAYPVLMAELTIGRYAKRDTVTSVLKVSTDRFRPLAYLTAYWGILTASLILSFYAIVAGWFVAYALASVADLLSFTELVKWCQDSSLARNVAFSLVFYFLTIRIVADGVSSGIEKWSTRLMPILLLLMVGLIGYISMQPGASEGWRVYLSPDFSQILNPQLVISALGQAFFSLSLGVGTMMVYGSYISRNENLPKLGVVVAAFDIGIAFLAGLLVIPAMYVALHNGVEIYNEAGKLIGTDGLIFNVLPAFFKTMGAAGVVVSILFFILMTIAALTSAISLLEVPVAYATERHDLPRKKSAWAVGALVYAISLMIMFNFGALFSLVKKLTTQYSEPLIGFLFCIFVGWIWHRNEILSEIKRGYPDAEQGLFWKIWPNYIKFICPLIIAIIFYYSLSK